MAVSIPRPRIPRAWVPARISKRVLLVGLAVVLAAGGSYVALFGNPLTSSQKVLTYPTTAASTGTLKVTVTATGPISNAINFPLSFRAAAS